MGWGGTVTAMIHSIKMNRALAHKKKSLRQKYKEYEVAKNKESLHFGGVMSPEDKIQFKKYLAKNKRKSFIQIIVVFSIMAVALGSFLIWISTA